VPWDLLPHDFPPHASVLYYYGLWRDDGTDRRINAILRRKVRTQAGRASRRPR
jgi:transposase